MINEIKKFIEIIEGKGKRIDYDVILVTGSRGKSSTAHLINLFIYHISQNHPIRIGLFSKPHIFKINERIKINNEDISDEDFNYYYSFVENIDKEYLLNMNWFDKLVACAITYFIDKKVDVAIFEIGIGGKLDSTNALNSIINVITNITLEHTDILGKTIKEIATQKAGIIKNNSFVLTASTQGFSTIKYFSKINQAKLINIRRIFSYFADLNITETMDKFVFDYRFYIDFKYRSLNLLKEFFDNEEIIKFIKSINKLEINLPAKYLIDNVLLALLTSLKYMEKCKKCKFKRYYDEQIFKKVIDNFNKETRMETLVFSNDNRIDNKLILLFEGAKDLESLKNFLEELIFIKEKLKEVKKIRDDIEINILWAFSKGKDLNKLFNIIQFALKNFNKIYFSEHSIEPKKMSLSIIKNFVYKKLSKKISTIKHRIQFVENEVLLNFIDDYINNNKKVKILAITGSIYFISHILSYLKLLKTEPNKNIFKYIKL